ncbi:MAG TPA: hypothetical protein VGD26_06455, partial [Chitinophagaceae bacterium]
YRSQQGKSRQSSHKGMQFHKDGFSDDWIEAFRHLDTKYKSLLCFHIGKLKLSSTSELVS